MVEWFLPGTEPTRIDDWQQGGQVSLPAEYAEWLASGDYADMTAGGAFLTAATPAHETTALNPAETAAPRRIVSPAPGDLYERPAAIDPRFATVPLTVSRDAGTVRWFADGERLPSPRWQLADGDHWIRAQWPDGHADSVRITVR
jgi:hypothetical protein